MNHSNTFLNLSIICRSRTLEVFAFVKGGLELWLSLHTSLFQLVAFPRTLHLRRVSPSPKRRVRSCCLIQDAGLRIWRSDRRELSDERASSFLLSKVFLFLLLFGNLPISFLFHVELWDSRPIWRKISEPCRVLDMVLDMQSRIM